MSVGDNDIREVLPLGDRMVRVRFPLASDMQREMHVRGFVAALQAHALPFLRDVVPAFDSVCLHIDPVRMQAAGKDFPAWLQWLAALALVTVNELSTRVRRIPVCFDGDCAPDLEELAARVGMAREDVIALLLDTHFRVAMVGFAPGFPYMTGLPAVLRQPRKATPRPRVAAGSIAVAERLCGIYPVVSPGGWHILGRTPLTLFDPARAEPAWLMPGDEVVLERIGQEAFGTMAGSSAPEPVGNPECNATDILHGMEILHGGTFSTLQDNGRYGWQALGVTLGGAVDDYALRVGNLLLGNAESAVAVEMTVTGMRVRFLQDTLIALTGAPLEVVCEGVAVPMWRPVWMRAGTVLEMGRMLAGLRTYLCVQEGFAVDEVLGARGTDVRNGFGGWHGRALRAGDVIPVAAGASSAAKGSDCKRYNALYQQLAGVAGGFVSVPWQVSVWRDWQVDSTAPLGVLPGRQLAELSVEDRAALWGEAFRVSAQSDRQALRLQGPRLHVADQQQVSAGVGFGVIQLPRDGQPIVLLADHQTTGGYPVIGVVASVDRSRLAQARPGAVLHFAAQDVEEAQRRMLAREARLGYWRRGLQW